MHNLTYIQFEIYLSITLIAISISSSSLCINFHYSVNFTDFEKKKVFRFLERSDEYRTLGNALSIVLSAPLHASTWLISQIAHSKLMV